MKFIIGECNCIPFFFPESCEMLISVKQGKHSKFAYFSALNESSRARICQMADMHCLDRIRVQIYSVAPPDNATGFEKISNKSNIGLKCDCLPGCHETVCQSIEIFWKWTDSYVEFLFNLFFRHILFKHYWQTGEEHQMTQIVNLIASPNRKKLKKRIIQSQELAVWKKNKLNKPSKFNQFLFKLR